MTVLIAAAGAVAGVWLAGIPDVSRRMIPFSGLLLVSLSVFLILPELAERFGLAMGTAFLLAGGLFILVIDRFVVPICPACSHTHDHATCHTRLHGFENPLIAAALLHGLFDGWTLEAAGGSEAFRVLLLGVVIHKIPEALAYGAMLSAAFASRRKAYVWAVVLQLAMLAGVYLHRWLGSGVDGRLLGLMLALGGGMFLYLGGHAVHAEWRRRGAAAAHKHA